MAEKAVKSHTYHSKEWRDPEQITSQWQEANAIDPKLFHVIVRGDWWETLSTLGITLLITREYEHLVMALAHDDEQAEMTFQPMPHPSGLVVDHHHGVVYIANTRNPNQVYDFEPVTGQLMRTDMSGKSPCLHRPLVPVRSRFYPGCMYFHDLALIDDSLYANAVAHNAVVRLESCGGYERVWWPRCIETDRGPVFSGNHLQLNSIAAGKDINSSFFSASAAQMSRRRPGHRNFPVDKRGLIFSGSTREPCVQGLTRPHSVRLYRNRLWVDNSGYAEFGYVDAGRFVPVVRLPGWTRGLCFAENVAFVGTSRVLRRFRHYAPGIEIEQSLCGVHAFNIDNGQVIGSLIWPDGNQIFAIDWMPQQFSLGFPFHAKGKRATMREKQLFYAFETDRIKNRRLICQ